MDRDDRASKDGVTIVMAQHGRWQWWIKRRVNSTSRESQQMGYRMGKKAEVLQSFWFEPLRGWWNIYREERLGNLSLQIDDRQIESLELKYIWARSMCVYIFKELSSHRQYLKSWERLRSPKVKRARDTGRSQGCTVKKEPLQPTDKEHSVKEEKAKRIQSGETEKRYPRKKRELIESNNTNRSRNIEWPLILRTVV